jgi:hypothetical protein
MVHNYEQDLSSETVMTGSPIVKLFLPKFQNLHILHFFVNVTMLYHMHYPALNKTLKYYEL